MKLLVRSMAAALALAIVATACGGEGTFPDGSFAVRASGDLGTGSERLLLGIGGPNGSRLGAPEDPVVIEVAPADDPTATQRTPGIWTWIVPEATGLYRARFDFDRPGTWLATVIPEEGPSLEPVPFLVLADPLAPALGEPAPSLVTPTLADLPLERLTTDLTPDPAFYEVSLDEALTNGRRTVLVFSTPAYCQTAACGPLLDNVQDVSPQYPDVDFIHVEVFTEFWTEDFAPTPAYLAPSAGPDGFSLPSEPWVFVMDETGTVVARFEGVMAPEELAPFLG
jgi:hypothetical protein